ncbi:ABC transporter ATP-binding protein [Streptomyces marincola]|uniref:ABC transporter ATP-binding protein n=1 Tax=Streptomyces marincola TaxID=2878388 RepID=UPI001CF46771|nr:ABC transporter ATP-binding protein [Streptomyces marincola]UCM86649.1 ABC transporter ATP-binding protein [Streptomyces marincola]
MNAHAAVLSAHEVSWTAGGRRLVEDVTLTAPAGGFTGLIGPNGSGKSTLLRLLAGLRRPSAGRVLMDGVDLASLRRADVARRLSFTAQEVASEVELRVRDVVALGRLPHRPRLAAPGPEDERVAREAMERLGVAGLADRSWPTLSGGERQRVNIARALAQEPGVLLLDEPMNHLDVRHQLGLLELLAAAPVTVVAALHDLDLAARYCGRLVLLDAGRVVAHGPPDEVLTPAHIERVYGVRATLVPGPFARPHLRLDPLPGPATA